ncbi:Copper chaperone CopZ [bacterium HR10]|nr:Copper chaperone CopZ [bacterium HR10]
MKRETTLVASVIAAITASLCCLGPIVAAVVGLGSFGAAAVFEAWRPYLLGLTFGLLGLGFYFTYRKQDVHCADGSVCATRPSVGRWNKILLWLATGLVIAFAAFPYYSGAVWALLSPKQETQADSASHLRSRTNELTGAEPVERVPSRPPQTDSPALAAESARSGGSVGGGGSASKANGEAVRGAGSAAETSAASAPSTTAAIRNLQDVPALARATIEIRGMDCAGCAVNVEQALKRLPGVKSVEASYEKGQAVVEYDPAKVRTEQLKAAIDRLGYKVGAVRAAQP